MWTICKVCEEREACEKRGVPCDLAERDLAEHTAGMNANLVLSKKKGEDSLETLEDFIDSEEYSAIQNEVYSGNERVFLNQNDLEEMLNKYDIFMPKDKEQRLRLMFVLYIHKVPIDQLAFLWQQSKQSIHGKLKTRVKRLIKKIKSDKSSKYYKVFPEELENPGDFQRFFNINYLKVTESLATLDYFRYIADKADEGKFGLKLGPKRGRPRKKK